MAKVDASKDFIRLEKTMDGLGGALRDVTKRLDNLEQAPASDISQLKRGKAKKKHSHSMASKIGSAYMSYATMGMMEEGGVVKSKRTKPVVANKQQLKDRKKQLIDDIMGL